MSLRSGISFPLPNDESLSAPADSAEVSASSPLSATRGEAGLPGPQLAQNNQIINHRYPIPRLYFEVIDSTVERVRKNMAPSLIAGVAMQVSPRVFVAVIENFGPAGMTKTLPVSLG